jgi:sugar phosphate permease
MMIPERREMPAKVKTARAVFCVLGALGLITAAAALSLVLYGSLVLRLTREEDALLGSALLGGLGFLIFGLSFLSGAVAFLVAAGISRRKAWGRVGGLALGGLMLPLLPVGTVLGLFVLTGLTGSEANSWFG